MSDAPQRLHPISPLFDLIGVGRQLALPLGAAVFSGQWWFTLPAVVTTFGQFLGWWRFTYQFDGEVVRIKEGILVRKERVIALDRVQQVDVISKLRHRLLGVVGLHVDTASGASGAELKLDVVRASEADALRQRLTAFTGAAPRIAAETSTVVEPPVVDITVGQLALAGMTGAQTIVILGFVLSLQEVLDFVDFDRFRRLVPDDAASDPLAIAIGVATLAAVWLGLAALAMVFTDFGYRLTIVNEHFRITRGLLDRREVGGALRRVQAVRIEQTFIRRLLGFAAIRVQTAVVPGQNVSKIVIPYVAVGDIERVVDAFLPSTAPWPQLTRASSAARTLALLRRVVPTTMIALLATVAAWPWGAVALLAVPVAVAAALLHARALGHAWAHDTIWARHGGLFRETVVVPAAKAQSLRLIQSPLQRRAAVSSLRIDLAGRSAAPRIPDAPTEELVALVAQIPPTAAADEHMARSRLVGVTPLP